MDPMIHRLGINKTIHHPIRAKDDTLEEMFRRRGLEIFRKNPSDGLLFSAMCQDKSTTLPSSLNEDLSGGEKLKSTKDLVEKTDTLYALLKRYSFRLLIRDLIHAKGGALLQELTRYCSEASVARYLKTLEKLGIVRIGVDERCRFIGKPPLSFGETLEWFVAEVFKREFACEAIFGVSFKGSTSGGDYDVIAKVEGNMAYVEVKSSPPKGIEQNEIQAFFFRLEDLLPHVAFFFVDTELRMKDKIVPMFEAGIAEAYGQETAKKLPVERLRGELFHIDHRIFIVNSKKGIIHNFTHCLRDFFRTTQSSLKGFST